MVRRSSTSLEKDFESAIVDEVEKEAEVVDLRNGGGGLIFR